MELCWYGQTRLFQIQIGKVIHLTTMHALLLMTAIALASILLAPASAWNTSLKNSDNMNGLIKSEYFPDIAGSGSLSPVLLSGTVWVSKNGVNAQGQRNNLSKPFLTVQAAINAAQSGDAIMIMPGTYTESVGINKDCKVIAWNATISGTLAIQANVQLEWLTVNNTNASAESLLMDASNVTLTATNCTFASLGDGIDVGIARTGFTVNLVNTNINSSNDCIQFANVLTADNVSLNIAGGSLRSLLQPLELGQCSDWRVRDCLISNQNSVQPVGPVDFTVSPTSPTGYRGELINCKVIGSATATNALFPTVMNASAFVMLSNCQSNKAWPAGSGFLINNCFTDSNITE